MVFPVGWPNGDKDTRRLQGIRKIHVATSRARGNYSSFVGDEYSGREGREEGKMR